MIDINISKVCKSFGFDLVLNNIDVTVQKGEKVGLIGTNGSGKSTILKIIAGQESIDSGSLSIRNNISIGYLSQIPEEKDIIVKDYINSAFKEIIELKDGGLVVYKCRVCGKTKEAMPSNVQVYGNQHKNCNKIK